MKRTAINLLSLLVIVLGTKTLAAQESKSDSDETNYQTCMRICREDGNSFTYCNGECKGLGASEELQ